MLIYNIISDKSQQACILFFLCCWFLVFVVVCLVFYFLFGFCFCILNKLAMLVHAGEVGAAWCLGVCVCVREKGVRVREFA